MMVAVNRNALAWRHIVLPRNANYSGPAVAEYLNSTPVVFEE